jgi:hypothetical protein
MRRMRALWLRAAATPGRRSLQVRARGGRCWRLQRVRLPLQQSWLQPADARWHAAQQRAVAMHLPHGWVARCSQLRRVRLPQPQPLPVRATVSCCSRPQQPAQGLVMACCC